MKGEVSGRRRTKVEERQRRTGDRGKVLVVVGRELGVSLGKETVTLGLVVGVVRRVSVLAEVLAGGTVRSVRLSLVLLDLVLDSVLDLLAGGAGAVRVGGAVAVGDGVDAVGASRADVSAVVGAGGGRVVVRRGGSLVGDLLASRLVGGGVGGGVVGDGLNESMTRSARQRRKERWKTGDARP